MIAAPTTSATPANKVCGPERRGWRSSTEREAVGRCQLCWAFLAPDGASYLSIKATCQTEADNNKESNFTSRCRRSQLQKPSIVPGPRRLRPLTPRERGSERQLIREFCLLIGVTTFVSCSRAARFSLLHSQAQPRRTVSGGTVSVPSNTCSG